MVELPMSQLPVAKQLLSPSLQLPALITIVPLYKPALTHGFIPLLQLVGSISALLHRIQNKVKKSKVKN